MLFVCLYLRVCGVSVSMCYFCGLLVSRCGVALCFGVCVRGGNVSVSVFPNLRRGSWGYSRIFKESKTLYIRGRD